MVEKLVQWAQTAEEPLRSYSIGLLAGAMEMQDIATNFRDTNDTLVRSHIRCLNNRDDISKLLA